jgi:hypothetical protein
MLTSTHLPAVLGNSMPQMLGNLPQMLGAPLPTFLSGPIPYVDLTWLEWAGLAAGLAASFGSIALGRKGHTTLAKVTAGLGGLTGLGSTVLGGLYFYNSRGYDKVPHLTAGAIDVGAGVTMIGASWHGWRNA